MAPQGGFAGASGTRGTEVTGRASDGAATTDVAPGEHGRPPSARRGPVQYHVQPACSSEKSHVDSKTSNLTS